jgi:hypothetical protein
MVAVAPFDAELWLVHRLPNGTEEVQRQIVRFGSNSSPFNFPLVAIAMAQGRVDIDVTGMLRLVSDEGAPTRVHIAITRRIGSEGQPDRFGNTGRLMPVPPPTDVIAFELPWPADVVPDSLVGHRFSVRLRVTPR